ncbi:MOSC domain-containing protein [Nonomuraea sp. NPDC050556]|uniref:MOSC domain-containing protein n=1 Tax=Nonomuraea sp. NPDC050556 TaxID=3364369 RepID=UPI0037A5E009
MRQVGTIDALYRYPVKSLLGEELAVADVGERGVAGDRARAVIDVATGKVASAKNPRLWAGLLTLDGTAPPDDAALSRMFGREVRLADVPPEGAELERSVPEEVLEKGIAAEVGMTISRIGAAAPGTFFDFAPLHVITTSTVESVGVEVVRYRPNLVIRTPEEGFVENAWVGGTLHIGEDLVIEVIVPSPRCSVPTLAHGDLPRDTDALRMVAKHNLVQVLDLGKRACAGVYARVQNPGTIRPGDPVLL